KGSLQSKKRSLEANLRKSSTHMRGRGRICMLLKDLSTPRQLWPRLGMALWLPIPRIGVEVHAYAWKANSSRSYITFRQAQT
ncbi:hypothetical protein PIB30_114250, partial [Stylosanthes scabra]|nr:hypothetical protein [Stylosanthes scabra]